MDIDEYISTLTLKRRNFFWVCQKIYYKFLNYQLFSISSLETENLTKWCHWRPDTSGQGPCGVFVFQVFLLRDHQLYNKGPPSTKVFSALGLSIYHGSRRALKASSVSYERRWYSGIFLLWLVCIDRVSIVNRSSLEWKSFCENNYTHL